MANLIKYRAFKVKALKATNASPARVRITDLLFYKSFTLHYSSKSANTMMELAIDYLANLGIPVVATSWSEVNGVFDYHLLLTENFNIQLKKIDE